MLETLNFIFEHLNQFSWYFFSKKRVDPNPGFLSPNPKHCCVIYFPELGSLLSPSSGHCGGEPYLNNQISRGGGNFGLIPF